MRIALDELIEKSQGVENGRMFYRITDFTMPTPEVLGDAFSRLPKLFSPLGKYDKCADVTDTDRIRKAIAIEGAAIPDLPIKSFSLDEQGAAEEWLET